jgi:hypothetical protein
MQINTGINQPRVWTNVPADRTAKPAAPIIENESAPNVSGPVRDTNQTGDNPYFSIIIRISPEGRAMYEASKNGGNGEAPADIFGQGGENELYIVGGANEANKLNGTGECQTCNSRRYVDQSNDPSVSFQSPTQINPGAAMSAVSAHERQHVGHERAKAAENGGKVVSQTVTIHTDICPECGRIYVSGGETRTTTSRRVESTPQNVSGGQKSPEMLAV